jgi:hypothetical protein
MKLYLVSQSENNNLETYDSMVVAAETPNEARKESMNILGADNAWTLNIKAIKVKHIGEAKNKKAGIILASFNAG